MRGKDQIVRKNERETRFSKEKMEVRELEGMLKGKKKTVSNRWRKMKRWECI